MTQHDQDAILGRTVIKHRDVQEKLAKLRLHARELGESLATVAKLLCESPESLQFSNEAIDARFKQGPFADLIDPRITVHPTIASLFIELRDEIRDAILEQERLEKSLKDMGLKC